MDSALKTGKLYEGAGYKYIQPAFAKNTLHFMGLLSDGGVHSRCDQLTVRTFTSFFYDERAVQYEFVTWRMYSI